MTIESDISSLEERAVVKRHRTLKESDWAFLRTLHYEIVSGDKRLTLKISEQNTGEAIASTKIEKNEKLEHVPGATTAAYARALMLMQLTANKWGKEILYEAVTRNHTMKLWILNRGVDVFEWEEIYESEAGLLHARRTVSPS